MSFARAQTQQPHRRMVSLEVAAETLGVSPKTIRRMIAAGEITGYKVGAGSAGRRPIRVDAADLDALLHPIPTGDPRAI